MCDSPRSDVFMRAMIQVEDILSLCQKNCYLRNKKNSAVIILGMSIVNVLSVVRKIFHSEGICC